MWERVRGLDLPAQRRPERAVSGGPPTAATPGRSSTSGLPTGSQRRPHRPEPLRRPARRALRHLRRRHRLLRGRLQVHQRRRHAGPATNDGALGSMFSTYGWWFGNIRVRSRPTRTTSSSWACPCTARTNGGASWCETGGNMHVDHHALDFCPEPAGPRLRRATTAASTARPTAAAPGPSSSTSPPTSSTPSAIDYLQRPSASTAAPRTTARCARLTGSTDDWETHLRRRRLRDRWSTPPTATSSTASTSTATSTSPPTAGPASTGPATASIAATASTGTRPTSWIPAIPTSCYYGTNRVYRSDDGAGNWTAISRRPHRRRPGRATWAPSPPSPWRPRRRPSSYDRHRRRPRLGLPAPGGGLWIGISTRPAQALGHPRARSIPPTSEIVYVTFSGLRWDEPHRPRLSSQRSTAAATWERHHRRPARGAGQRHPRGSRLARACSTWAPTSALLHQDTGGELAGAGREPAADAGPRPQAAPAHPHPGRRHARPQHVHRLGGRHPHAGRRRAGARGRRPARHAQPLQSADRAELRPGPGGRGRRWRSISARGERLATLHAGRLEAGTPRGALGRRATRPAAAWPAASTWPG